MNDVASLAGLMIVAMALGAAVGFAEGAMWMNKVWRKPPPAELTKNDPWPLDVRCPRCLAAPGRYCDVPRGRFPCVVHAERVEERQS